jgi:hypothetical protein
MLLDILVTHMFWSWLALWLNKAQTQQSSLFSPSATVSPGDINFDWVRSESWSEGTEGAVTMEDRWGLERKVKR